MAVSKPSQEALKDPETGKEILFDGSFGLINALDDAGEDASVIFSEFNEGLLPVKKILLVLRCACQNPPKEFDGDFYEHMIGRYGLQECGLIAHMLLSHSMIGDVKKSQIKRQEIMTGLMDSLLPSTRKSFLIAGCLWVASCAISTLAACMISSL